MDKRNLDYAKIENTGVSIDTACTLGMCAERNAIANMITNGEDTKFVLGLNVSFKQYTGEPENNNNPQPDNTGGSENGEQEPSGGETPVEPETPVDPVDPDNPDNPDNTEDPEQQEPES